MEKTTVTYKNIWQISWPIVAGSVAHTTLNLTDTAFLGRVGETELGAAAIAGVLYFILIMLGMAVGIGSQILIARRMGENKAGETGSIFVHTLVIQTLGGITFSIFLYAVSPLMFSRIIQSKHISDAAVVYIQSRGWAVWPAMLLTGCRGLYVGVGRTKAISVSSAIMFISNVILDYMLIFGNWGLPEMGIAGAGLASGIAETMASVYLLGYARFRKEFKEFNLYRLNPIRKSSFLPIINLSMPVMVQNFISMGAWFLFFVFIERMGSRELAVSNVIRATYMVLMTPMWGFAAAANSLTSNLIGQGKPHQVFNMLRKVITMSLFLSLIIGILFVIFPTEILSLVTNDRELISYSYGSFYVTCFSILVISISLMLLNCVSGTGNTRIAMWIEAISIVFYLLYIYACTNWWYTSLEWMWFSEVIYWSLIGLASFYYLRSGHWKKLKI
ncbi:MAG: MATE family efflux transporter [Bacteroidia bacterium]|nr:MATE family efflux transporter [Bacteroidia bacterium]MCZ2277333.1 MATE family efflux transporter [Bacteroidia bacterium]